ncbi:MAG TPA: protein kinase [Phycisphaerae bacterium]|nr:protein kinase [Phycisphaerae bacterium]
MPDSDPISNELMPPEPPREGSELARAAGPISTGLPTGTGLGKYRILERIRAYHNAVVYKARDTMLDRLVALKQMSPELMDHPTACGNFKKEAQLLARVPKDARHVLNVHELIEDEIGLFIVEEYIHGDWLESLIAKRRIGVGDAYRLLRTAAIGLRDLHTQKIVHRDINPGNVMVARGSQAKIANFYSAAQEGDTASPPVITPKYSAPELLLEQSYDDRVDLYSLGMAVYEVCVGRAAMDKLFAQIVNSRVPVEGWIRWHTDFKATLPDPAKVNPLVPSGLSMVIRQMTAKRLEERYSCIEEAIAAITRHARPVVQPGGIRPAVFAPRPVPAFQPAPAARLAEDLLSSTQRLHARTATHTVRPAAKVAAPPPHRPAAPWPSIRREPMYTPRAEARRAPRIVPPSTHRIMPAPLMPAPSTKLIRRRRRSFISQATAAVLLVAIGAGGMVGLNRYLEYTPTHPIDAIFEQAKDAYSEDKLKDAKSLFEQASQMSVKYASHQLKRDQSKRWLMMVDARAAFEHDEFDRALKLLREVERQGDVSPAKRNELLQKIWSKQDAYRAAAQGFDEIRSGNFQGAEQKLDDYEKNATVAGLDPNALKDKLSNSRKEKEYADWMKNAEDSLAKHEFEKAFTACNRAEDYMITTDTRDLRRRIIDARKQADQVTRGDQAMLSEEWNEALSAYEEAIRLGATHEIEVKARGAKARVFYNDALDAIARGDLLVGEDKLKSSIWYSPLYEAQAKLEKMKPIFDAARVVREADSALEKQNITDALRLYQQALPRLPDAAANEVKKKIREIHRLDLVSRGEKSFQHEDWLAAISALEEAQQIAFDPAVEDKLVRAKAKLP